MNPASIWIFLENLIIYTRLHHRSKNYQDEMVQWKYKE